MQRNKKSSNSSFDFQVTVPQDFNKLLSRGENGETISWAQRRTGRATQACLRCRKRKVRCDVTRKTGKCTNCLLDRTECKVIDHGRHFYESIDNSITFGTSGAPKRRLSKSTMSSENKDTPIARKQTSSKTNTAPGNIWGEAQAPWRFTSPGEDSGQSTALGLNPMDMEPPECSLFPSSTKIQSETLDYEKSMSRDLVQLNNTRISPRTDTLSTHRGQDSSQGTSLPDFIEAFTLQNENDLDYLRRRSVFVLPQRQLQRIILDSYADFVQPLLPIIDLAEFRSVVYGRSHQSKRISLLLFHAVMFAGVGAVEADVVLRHSYMSKLAAREAYYERAKALFDLDIEKDRMTIFQASLLLIGWAKGDNLKDATYWLGIAIGQALLMNLNRPQQAGGPNGIGQRERNRHRVLWWCVLMKECDLCMYIRQLPRVWPMLPMLTLSDFDFDEQGTGGVDGMQKDNADLLLKQATVCIQKAKLCGKIYNILQHIHQDAMAWSSTGFGSSFPALRQHMIQELHRWHSEVPPELKWSDLLPGRPYQSYQGVGWAMVVIELIYWGAHTLIYKDDMIRDISEHLNIAQLTEKPPQAEYSRILLRETAYEITDILEKFLAHDLHKFLPPSALTIICLAAAILFRDFNNPNRNVRSKSLSKADICVKSSRPLADHGPALKEVAITLQETSKNLRSRFSRLQSNLIEPNRSADGRGYIIPRDWDEASEIGQQSIPSGSADGGDHSAPKFTLNNDFSTAGWFLDDLGLGETSFSEIDISSYTWA